MRARTADLTNHKFYFKFNFFTIKKNMPKLFWTCDEDFALFLAVQIHGKDWNSIAFDMGIRSPKQCRERWVNHIDPKLSVLWTDDDILTLLMHYAIIGAKWSKISTRMGFSANAIKNRYNAIQQSLSTDCADPITTLLRYNYLIRWG